MRAATRIEAGLKWDSPCQCLSHEEAVCIPREVWAQYAPLACAMVTPGFFCRVEGCAMSQEQTGGTLPFKGVMEVSDGVFLCGPNMWK